MRIYVRIFQSVMLRNVRIVIVLLRQFGGPARIRTWDQYIMSVLREPTSQDALREALFCITHPNHGPSIFIPKSLIRGSDGRLKKLCCYFL